VVRRTGFESGSSLQLSGVVGFLFLFFVGGMARAVSPSKSETTVAPGRYAWMFLILVLAGEIVTSCSSFVKYLTGSLVDDASTWSSQKL